MKTRRPARSFRGRQRGAAADARAFGGDDGGQGRRTGSLFADCRGCRVRQALLGAAGPSRRGMESERDGEIPEASSGVRPRPALRGGADDPR